MAIDIVAHGMIGGEIDDKTSSSTEGWQCSSTPYDLWREPLTEGFTEQFDDPSTLD